MAEITANSDTKIIVPMNGSANLAVSAASTIRFAAVHQPQAHSSSSPTRPPEIQNGIHM